VLWSCQHLRVTNLTVRGGRESVWPCQGRPVHRRQSLCDCLRLRRPPAAKTAALASLHRHCHHTRVSTQHTYTLLLLHKFNGLFSRTTWASTHSFNVPLSGTTRVNQYQAGRTNLDFTEARDSEWQWHQLGHMEVCTSLQTDNHASTPPLGFLQPDALPAAQLAASKH